MYQIVIFAKITIFDLPQLTTDIAAAMHRWQDDVLSPGRNLD
jgi:hypothetical protein